MEQNTQNEEQANPNAAIMELLAKLMSHSYTAELVQKPAIQNVLSKQELAQVFVSVLETKEFKLEHLKVILSSVTGKELADVYTAVVEDGRPVSALLTPLFQEIGTDLGRLVSPLFGLLIGAKNTPEIREMFFEQQLAKVAQRKRLLEAYKDAGIGRENAVRFMVADVEASAANMRYGAQAFNVGALKLEKHLAQQSASLDDQHKQLKGLVASLKRR